MSKKHIDQTVNEIITGFKKLNFRSTDNVYLGIDLGKIFINDYQKIFESGDLTLNEIRKYSINKIIENLKSYFKNGTIIVPSFNFDYFKERKFNKNQTKSSLGPFENSFIKAKGVSRSNHPIFSISAFGKNKKKILTPCGLFSFGQNSPFNNFIKNNVIFLNIGLPFKSSCTYVHHVEHLSGVNHRYYKAVSGKVFESGKYINKTYYSFVRYKSVMEKVKRAEYKIEGLLKNKKYLKEVKNSKVYLSKVYAKNVFSCANKALQLDPSFFLEKKTIVKTNY
jgi:aminoglycoside 3-N-acetyltransferase